MRHPGPADDAPFPEAFWVELGYALVDDTALFPQPDPPVDPTAGDLAGPVNAPLPEPDS